MPRPPSESSCTVSWLRFAERLRGVWLLLATVFALMLSNAPMRAQVPEQVMFKIEPCFVNMSPGGIYPVAVTVTNRGAPLSGSLVVFPQTGDAATREYGYPLSLPTGSTKRVLVYPNVVGYGSGLAVIYQSGFRNWDTTMPFNMRGGASGEAQVGLIGDRTGGLVSRGSKANNGSSSPPGGGRDSQLAFNDCYCKPETAPDRAAGYSALDILVIGEGAERMTDGQWQAIGQWVLRGGSLVLVGGANAAYLRAPAVAPLLPIANMSGGSLARFEGQNVPGYTFPPTPIAVTTGTPTLGATVVSRAPDGRPLLVAKSRGAGKILFVAFDPMERPLRGTTETAQLWQWLIQNARSPLSTSRVSQIVQEKQSAFDEDNSGATVGVYGPRRGGGNAAAAVNPFRITLPDIGLIIGLFVAYFVLAVPVTFFVLRRIGKQELAWVTTPLLAVAFSFGLYLFTADLYKAGLSRRTGGVVVASAGEREARFSGFTEIFFPTGGSYKIEIPNAETLETRDAGDDLATRYGRGSGASENRSPLQTVDTGVVVAPGYGVSNLSFRRLTHTQRIDFGNGISAQVRRVGRRLVGSIRNDSGRTLRGAMLMARAVGGNSFADRRRGLSRSQIVQTLGEIKSGETKVLMANKKDEDGTSAASVTLQMLDRNGEPIGNQLPANSALLVADTDGDRDGPQLGKSVSGNQSVTVIVSVPLLGGGN